MSNQAELSAWDRAGAMIDEMDAAGMAVELHRTSSGKADFAWAFAARSKGDTISLRRFTYGATPHEAVARGHAAWVEWREGSEE